MNRKRLAIRIKRVYDEPASGDGRRILVDRLWPRGLSKEKAKVDLWVKEIAPSTQLRQWYGHDPDKWEDFQSKYQVELEANPEGVLVLLREVQETSVTFLFSSKEAHLNNAVALKAYIELVASNDS